MLVLAWRPGDVFVITPPEGEPLYLKIEDTREKGRKVVFLGPRSIRVERASIAGPEDRAAIEALFTPKGPNRAR